LGKTWVKLGLGLLFERVNLFPHMKTMNAIQFQKRRPHISKSEFFRHHSRNSYVQAARAPHSAWKYHAFAAMQRIRLKTLSDFQSPCFTSFRA
jgi:hypothetical protein